MPQFRDPIHGFIFISDDEQKIVDSAPFQRLRHIRQLATTYLVYHGAEHTRFGHSIGTMHLVTRVFDFVVSKKPKLFRENVQENEVVIMWYRQILRLIALTHDLGHSPFSHASEVKNFKHEEYTKKIIEETVVAKYISEIGEKLHKDLAGKLEISPGELQKKYKVRPITPELIWMIYGGKPRAGEEYIWPDFVFLHSFMDSELDCDKMDYLLRDSLYCGVTYGRYDLDRFISSLTVYENKKENVLLLAISSGGLQAFEEFVLARYFMFIQVYFHKTRRYFDHLLVKGLREILPKGNFPKDIHSYLKWDDISVLYKMKQKATASTQEYFDRKAMSCVYESSAHAKGSDRRYARSLFSELEKNFSHTSFWFDSSNKKPHKLLPTAYSPEDDSGEGIKVLDKHTHEAKNVMDCSLILQGIVDRIDICRIYASGDCEEIKKIRDWINAKHAEYSE